VCGQVCDATNSIALHLDIAGVHLSDQGLETS
jgi:hypothetical protein